MCIRDRDIFVNLIVLDLVCDYLDKRDAWLRGQVAGWRAEVGLFLDGLGIS